MSLEHIVLNDKEFDFYVKNVKVNPKELIFKKEKLNFSYKKIAIQIQSRNKCLKKLPTWANTLKIVYPKQLSLEQCSSERTALYKQQIIPKGTHFADLTGGFGVDTAFLSKNFIHSAYYELNNELAEIVKTNFTHLNINAQVNGANGVESILQNKTLYDVIYLDPARRKEDKKVFRLEDCTPNLIEHQDALLNKTVLLCSKHSPLLDINHIIQTLHHIKSIYIVSVVNECKEILIFQDKLYTNNPEIIAVNLIADDKKEEHSCIYSERQTSCNTSDEDSKYIYIPNSSILKAGISETIAKDFDLNKFSSNTHFYLSNTLHNSYPGRCFEVLIKDNKVKTFKKLLAKQKRDVICRNSSYKPDDLAKKLNLVRGNDTHFVLSGNNNNQTTYFFDCKRIF